jgi:hypothetical protein
MISARPSCQGVNRSVWDPKTFAKVEARPTVRAVSEERIGVWDGQTDVSAPLCPPRRATWPNGEWGLVLAVVCWAPSAQRRCYPTGRCAYRTSVTCSLSIKLLTLSLPLSLSLSLSLARALSLSPTNLRHDEIMYHGRKSS